MASVLSLLLCFAFLLLESAMVKGFQSRLRRLFAYFSFSNFKWKRLEKILHKKLNKIEDEIL